MKLLCLIHILVFTYAGRHHAGKRTLPETQKRVREATIEVSRDDLPEQAENEELIQSRDEFIEEAEREGFFQCAYMVLLEQLSDEGKNLAYKAAALSPSKKYVARLAYVHLLIFEHSNRARTLLTEAVSAHPDDIHLVCSLAKVYIYLGCSRSGEICLQFAKNNNPSNPLFYIYLAVFQNSMKKRKDAINTLRKLSNVLSIETLQKVFQQYDTHMELLLEMCRMMGDEGSLLEAGFILEKAFASTGEERVLDVISELNSTKKALGYKIDQRMVEDRSTMDAIFGIFLSAAQSEEDVDKLLSSLNYLLGQI